MAKKKAVRRPSNDPQVPWRKPLATIVYGPPGVGKTSFAAQFPGVVFVHDDDEDGILDLMEYGIVQPPLKTVSVNNFNALMDTVSGTKLASLIKTGMKTLVIDSLTSMELLCFRHHCQKYFQNNWSDTGFFAFWKGPKNAAKTDWMDFINALSLVQQEGVNVIMLAHSQVKPYSNPTGPDYDRFTPYLDKECWQAIHRWAQLILFLNHHVDAEKESGKLKAKAKGSNRVFFAEWSPVYDAKNLMGIEPNFDAGESAAEGYANFLRAFPQRTP